MNNIEKEKQVKEAGNNAGAGEGGSEDENEEGEYHNGK